MNIPKTELYPTYEDDRGSFTPILLSRKPEESIVWDQVNISVNEKKVHSEGCITKKEYHKRNM